ncbi:MAG: addiction module protein [Verrucomicrobia bacterium]|jgi:putative addiction module component (TIGR02574 family)|nr:addiction module protein [Verrucomicrobiota bacterium]
MTEVAEIEKAALQLPLGQRVSLAQTLLDSLPRVSEDVSEEAELAEAERREREIEAGQVQPISEAELWRRVESGRPA